LQDASIVVAMVDFRIKKSPVISQLVENSGKWETFNFTVVVESFCQYCVKENEGYYFWAVNIATNVGISIFWGIIYIENQYGFVLIVKQGNILKPGIWNSVTCISIHNILYSLKLLTLHKQFNHDDSTKAIFQAVLTHKIDPTIAT